MAGRRRAAVTLAKLGIGNGDWGDWDAGAQVLREVPVARGDVCRVKVVPDGAGGRRLVARDHELREVGARARLRTTCEPVPEDANGRRRRRIIHPIEDMHQRGVLDGRQRVAGLALADAWEACQRAPSVDLLQPRVDRTRRPDDRTVILLDAQHRYARLARQIPRDARAVIRHVCCEGRYLKDGFVRNGREMGNAVEILQMALSVMEV